MPELPEVEVVKQSLERTIKNKYIIDILVRNPNLRLKITSKFAKILKKKTILNIKRIAKYIIFELSYDQYLIIHLGMSGTLHLVTSKKSNLNTNLSFYSSTNLPKKHNHIEINFGNFKIVYNDPRRFGFFKIVNSKKKLNNYFSKKGLDPLQKQFNFKYLFEKFKNRKKNIKNILLDQNIISGIGNIYASEILFFCKINPNKEGRLIKTNEIKKIIKYSKLVLNKAIKKGGSSILNFRSTQGNMGNYQDEFKVYGKENKKCPNKNCKFKILKLNISNRSTFYCQNCQN